MGVITRKDLLAEYLNESANDELAQDGTERSVSPALPNGDIGNEHVTTPHSFVLIPRTSETDKPQGFASRPGYGSRHASSASGTHA